MFRNANLMFDIDDELDSIRKKRAFVKEVSQSHNFVARSPLITGTQST